MSIPFPRLRLVVSVLLLVSALLLVSGVGTCVAAGDPQAPTPTPAPAPAPAPAPSPTPAPAAGATQTPAPATGAATRGPAVGQPAPDFTLRATPGGDVRLADFKGKVVVLYFYPKDETPGCTKQACSFRDANAELQKAGAVVLGVSRDDLESHASFAQNHKLPFSLLSDPDGKVHDLYGAFKDGSMFGRTALGVDRSTFLIDRNGVVRRVWRSVKVDGHADEVLKAVREL